MSDESLIADLLVEWQERWERGEDASPEELCRPILAELRRRIAIVKSLSAVQATGPATLAADLRPAGDPTPSSAPGERYERVALHKRGGIGQVWLARDGQLARDVALKELRPEWTADPAVVTRFLNEAQITGQLEHPGVIPVYELDRAADGQPFYTMRFVNGRTLTEAARAHHDRRAAGEENALGLAALLHAFVVVCNTVGYAHSRGVLHRDLKGQNVLLGDFGEVVVLDWGLAKRVGRPEEAAAPATGNGEGADAVLTAYGQALGTPAYMAPEQAEGRPDRIDHRTDIYGLGAILYEILTGRAPFAGSPTAEVLRKVREEPPVPPRQLCADTPAGLEAICLRALAKGPEDRYGAAKELADAVQQWQEAERRQAEEALRASEEQYRLLAEAIPQIVWITRPGGWMEYCSSRAMAALGVGPEQVLGTAYQALWHPDDLAAERQANEAANAIGGGYEHVHRLRMPDGNYRWFLARGLPLRDASGHVVKWFGTSTDIDDLKRAQDERDAALAALRASEEQYRALADAIPHIVWIAAPDGTIEYINQRVTKETGVGREELLGMAWHQFMHPDDLGRQLEVWAAAQQAGNSFENEYRIRPRPNDPYRWYLGRALPVRDAAGKVVKWFGTSTDIHELKQAAEERARLQAAVESAQRERDAALAALRG
jgi:serine/threonine-protein kinase